MIFLDQDNIPFIASDKTPQEIYKLPQNAQLLRKHIITYPEDYLVLMEVGSNVFVLIHTAIYYESDRIYAL